MRGTLPLLGVLTLLGFALATWHPSRVAIQALLLLPAILPGTPLDPLAALTPHPTVRTHDFTYSAGSVQADVYEPGGRGTVAGLLLQYQGPRPVPRDDPTLVRFAGSLSRLGMVVVVPESSSLSAGRVVPEEREAVARAYELILQQPRVDAARTGIVGFSIGGSISLIAAASEEAIRHRVRAVNTLGSYYDARTLLVDVASRSTVVDGQIRPWAPSSQALEILEDLLAGSLPEGEREAWRGILREGSDRGEVERLAARLPATTSERLQQLSPSHFMDGLKARVFLMHDQGDTYVPFPHSRQLAVAAGAKVIRETEFSIFSHILPDRQVAWTTFTRDAWELFWHSHAFLLELL